MLTLVPFAPAHFPILAAWFGSEADVVQWGGDAMVYPLDARQMLAMLDEGGGDRPARLCWMAADDDGALVGHVQVAFDWRHGVARLARVGIAPAARGRGLGGQMVRLALARAFADPGIERAELNVYSWNVAAIRTYERLGFVREGTRRSAARVGAQRWDTAMMGLLRAEWEERARA
jgi:RimJ/RimL family protein N-acetyltransferase